MILGLPKEIKAAESRVALTPAGVHALVADGHQLLVETDAGLGSGFHDSDYEAAGARIVTPVEELWQEADMILKVKEPQAEEIARSRPGQILFTYFHFAADRTLTEGMMASGAHCFAYETLEVDGKLPLLTPMSEVAGRMAVQEGAKYLEKPSGGRGVLLSGIPGVEPGHVMILGGGTVGTNAAWIAAGLGARVWLFDIDLDRLRYLEEVLPANVTTLYSTPQAIREWLPKIDLLIGAVLVPGARAPRLVSTDDLKRMPTGSVLVDVAVDQGGCVESCHPTTHEDPVYEVNGVIHYCVANMPGAVARTSTFGLTNATLPWVRRLAKRGVKGALQEGGALASAANVIGGELVHPAVAASFGLPCAEPAQATAAL